ncbi:hypothetical protein AKJ16_DCAP16396 [Drosera capensis]
MKNRSPGQRRPPAAAAETTLPFVSAGLDLQKQLESVAKWVMAAKSKIKRTNQSAQAPKVKDSIRTDEEPQHETNEASTVNEEDFYCKAMSEMELEHLLTSLRLLRSYISEEHLQLPVSQFCKKHLPNLSLVKDGTDGHFSLRWKEEDGCVAMRNVNSSLLGGDALRFGNYAMRELSNKQTFGLQDGLHAPGVCSQRMSVGMTPKT